MDLGDLVAKFDRESAKQWFAKAARRYAVAGREDPQKEALKEVLKLERQVRATSKRRVTTKQPTPVTTDP